MKDRIVKKDVVEKSKLDSKLFKYTLSDLIIQSVYQSNDYYLKEAQKRLYYCGFSSNVINELIKSELNLSKLKDIELQISGNDIQSLGINIHCPVNNMSKFLTCVRNTVVFFFIKRNILLCNKSGRNKFCISCFADF